jgi:polar amino acid transport system substrate-binding protein
MRHPAPKPSPSPLARRAASSLAGPLLAAVLLATTHPLPAAARPLAQIKASGVVSVCLPTNSLPFSSRKDDPHGFEVELADALAGQLGVDVRADWIISPIQVARAACDLLLDVIADPQAQDSSHLALSRPYYRSGVALVTRRGDPVRSFADLGPGSKVAVQVGSMVAMILGERHVGMSTFAFEDEMLDALAAGEVTQAAVTPLAAAFYSHRHPEAGLVILPPDESDPRLVWNVAVGMRRPDKPLREAIDKALDQLAEAGTIGTIYGRYGITLTPPKP